MNTDPHQTTKSRHPGRTPAQRRVLDEIGCGNHSPWMDGKTRNALLAASLIVELPPRVLSGRLPVSIRQYDMPTPVHMAWCEACAEECPDDI